MDIVDVEMKNSEKLAVTTYIFDCFDVILGPVVTLWYREKSKKFGFVDNNLPEVLRKFDLGRLSENDLVQYLLKYPLVDTTAEKVQDEIDRYLKINEALVEIIKKLKEKKFKTALLSNANNEFFERKVYKTYPEFKDSFDEIVISSSVKMVKPDEEIYLYTLDKIGSKAGECVFVDDNQKNVDTAIRLGMAGYLYKDTQSFLEYISK